jgi:PAS domain S-box-containing protein
MATDISAQKQFETAHLHLAAIVESSNDAIVSKDLNGIITSWNKGAERIFGYTAVEIIGKPVSTLAATDQINEMPKILDKIRRGERVEHYETLRRRKDGQIVHVSLTVSPIRDELGRIIGASKIARDISDRKQFEAERDLLLSREREARKTAELLNRVGPLLAAELDREKLVQSVTDIATELVGAEFGSFFHNVANENGESYLLYALSGAPREAFVGLPNPRNTEIFGPTFRGEGILRCDDITCDPRYSQNPPYYGMPEGHFPIRSYLAAPVTSRSGEVLGGLFFGHSSPGKFTERHEAILIGLAAQAAIAMDNARLFEKAQWVQNELKRSNEELQRANQDLETFAYSASHDLQEPLRTVALSAQLLERRYNGELQGDARRFLDSIVEGAQRMENLISDILAYATAAKCAEGPPPSVDSGKVLATALENLKGHIEQAGASVTSEPLPVVLMHENRLLQLFQNLISNALKYRGKEIPRIHISAVERDGWSVFSVVDNGIGIDKKFADSIFGLFKRLHSRAEYPGSGIGLAICQRIVEQYRGQIWLENSIPGEGSTFCFSLPTSTVEQRR